MSNYTSQSISENCPLGKSFQVWFSPRSAAHQEYGAYIVGWRLELEADSPADSDFLLNFEVLTKANALPEVGNQYEADIPQLTKASFRGSEVTDIKYR